MDPVDTPRSTARRDDHDLRCRDCESALRSPGRDTVSFLLLDRFTIPLVGCDDHLERFSELCGLATETSPELLDHRPAGGLPCPGCRHAAYDVQRPVLPVGSGGLALLVCTTHQSDIVARFRAGLQVRRQLDASLDAFSTDT